MLDYTLTWLLNNKINHIVIYTSVGSHDRIKAHVRSFHKKQFSPSTCITLLAAKEIRSSGDVLRDLYARDIIHDDFVLLRGDSLANFDLSDVFLHHRELVKADPKAVMTRVLMPVEENEFYKCTYRVSTTTDLRGRILEYKRLRLGLKYRQNVEATIKRSRRVVVTCHQPDPSVTICSLSVLGLFTDNFDYTTIDYLVEGLVSPDDLNDCNVYQHIVSEGNGMTIGSWFDYEHACYEIMNDRYGPMYPNISLSTGRERYRQTNLLEMVYKAESTELVSTYGKNSDNDLPSEHTQLVFGECFEAPKSVVMNKCTFGNYCKVGENTRLYGAFVGNNCSIGANCSLSKCYIGDNVVILDKTILEDGCVVSSDVTLGPDTTITKASLIANNKVFDNLDEFEKDPSSVRLSPSAVLLNPSVELGGHNRETADGITIPIWGLKDSDTPEANEAILQNEGGLFIVLSVLEITV